MSSAILTKKVLPREQAQILLGKKIALQMTSLEKTISVTVEVEEVYKAFKDTLEKDYGPMDFAIRGSSVAGIFSGEKTSDLDLQAKFRFKHIQDRSAIVKEGYSLRWKLLDTIKALFLQKVSAQDRQAVLASSSEALRFKDTNKLLSFQNQGPCNIHQLQVGEIEISCFVEVDPSQEPVRNFDFNSGSLEIIIDDNGRVILQGPCEDLEETIREISLKELRCIRPHEISRKALPRYFNKLFFSGYVDPSEDLLPVLIRSNKNMPAESSNEDIAQTLLQEMHKFFKDKKTPLWMIHMALWLGQDQDPVMQEISKRSQEPLLAYLDQVQEPWIAQIKSWVQAGNVEAVTWFFILQAQSLEVKTHRGQDHLQLQLDPSYPCYFLIPKQTLSKPPQGLEDLVEKLPYSVLKQELSAKTKELMQKTLARQAKHPQFFLFFEGCAQKFAFKPQEFFGNMFWQWFAHVPGSARDKIVLDRVTQLVPFSFLLPTENCYIAPFLLMLDQHQLSNKMQCFDPSMHPETVLQASLQLMKSKEFGQLCKEDQDRIATLIEKMYREYFLDHEPKAELVKLVLQFTLFLQKNQRISWDELEKSAKACFALHLEHEGDILLLRILQKGPKEYQPRVLQICLDAASHDPLWALNFIEKHSEDLKHYPEFSDELFSALHFSLLDKLSSQDFEKYSKHVLEIARLELRQSLAQRSAALALDGNANAKYFMEKMLESSSFDVQDVFDFDNMTNQEFESFLARFFASKTIKYEERSSKILLQTAFRCGCFGFAKEQLLKTIEQNPLKALEILLACSRHDLLKAPLEDLLCFSIALHDQGIRYEDSCEMQSWIDAVFISLQKACQKNSTQPMTDRQIELIVMLHKKFVLATYFHSVWIDVWVDLVSKAKDNRLQTWIPIDEFCEQLDKLSLEHMKPLFVQMDVSFDFIEKYAVTLYEFLKTHNPQQHKDLQSMLCNFVELSRETFWNLDPNFYRNNPAAQQQFQSVLDVVLATDFQDDPNNLYMNLLFLSLKGISLFCSAEFRKDEVVPIYVDIMYQYIKKHPNFFENSGRYQKLMISLIYKSFQEKDLSQGLVLYLLYRQYCSPDMTQQSLLKQEDSLVDLSIASFDHLCKDTLRLIDGCQFDVDSPKFREEIVTVNFFTCFVADMLLTFEEAISICEGPKKLEMIAKKQRVLGHTKDFFERLSKIGTHETFMSTQHIFKYREHFSLELKLELYKKLFKVLGDLIRAKKNTFSEQDMKMIGSLVNEIKTWVNTDDLASGVLEKEIKAFLEISRPLMFRSEFSIYIKPDLIEFIRKLESTLSKQAIQEYLWGWVESINHRSAHVLKAELDCFAILTLRLDEHFQAIFRDDPIISKLSCKGINFTKFFTDKEKIEAFIRLFDVAFTKFSETIPTMQDYESESSLNIFSLFVIASPHMRAGINQIKQEKEQHHLFSTFLNVLTKQMGEKSNFLTTTIYVAAWHCMFSMEKRPRIAMQRFGKPKFRFHEKEHAQRNCKVFGFLVNKLHEMTEDYRTKMKLEIRVLNDIFKMNEDLFKQHLTKQEFDTLSERIFEQLEPANKPALIIQRVQPDEVITAEPIIVKDVPEKASDFFAKLVALLPFGGRQDSEAEEAETITKSLEQLSLQNQD